MGEPGNDNGNRYDATGAACASLFLHVVLLLTLATASEFTPAIGLKTRIDLLWLTPCPAAKGETASQRTDEAAAAAPAAPAGGEDGEEGTMAAGATPASTGTWSGLPGHTPPPGRDRSPSSVSPPPKAEVRPPAAPPAVPAAISDTPPLRAQRTPAAAEKGERPAPAPRDEALPSPPSRAEAAAPVPAGRSGPPPAPQAPLKTAEAAKPAPERAAAVQPVPQPLLPRRVKGEGTQDAAAAPHPRASREAAAARTSAAQVPQERGVVVPSPAGDLKMLIVGDGSVRLSVTFRELPKARRKKPPTRAEAKRDTKVTPLFAAAKGGREAVIETAGEGVYVFRAESAGVEKGEAGFTLTIRLPDGREKVAPLGRRSISGKETIAKVLMPEGILWDDDASFTGSLEDSESTTKFNSETGLYWKEYND